MHGDDHIASTLKQCCSNARVIQKIVNILKVLKTPHPKIRSISIIPSFKLLNATICFMRNGKIIQIKEIAEIPVMPDGLCTPPPVLHTLPVPSATTLWDTFIITFFLGRHFTCPPLQTTNGRGNHGSPSKSFCVNATTVN